MLLLLYIYGYYISSSRADVIGMWSHLWFRTVVMVTIYQLRCCHIDSNTLRSRRLTIPIFGNWLYRIWYNSSPCYIVICCMNNPDIIIMKPNEGALVVSSLSHLISSSYYLQCNHIYPVMSMQYRLVGTEQTHCYHLFQ